MLILEDIPKRFNFLNGIQLQSSQLLQALGITLLKYGMFKVQQQLILLIVGEHHGQLNGIQMVLYWVWLLEINRFSVMIQEQMKQLRALKHMKDLSLKELDSLEIPTTFLQLVQIHIRKDNGVSLINVIW